LNISVIIHVKDLPCKNNIVLMYMSLCKTKYAIITTIIETKAGKS